MTKWFELTSLIDEIVLKVSPTYDVAAILFKEGFVKRIWLSLSCF